jgi:hypothetical protein
MSINTRETTGQNRFTYTDILIVKNGGLYFLGLHPVAHTTTIFNESTTFRNQTMSVLYIIYTALHVSAYMQAIFKCYRPTSTINNEQ